MNEVEQDVFRRQKIGFVFQQFNLIHNLSAVGNVLLPFIPHGPVARAATPRPKTCCARSGWATGSTTSRPSSPAASSSAWRSRGP